MSFVVLLLLCIMPSNTYQTQTEKQEVHSAARAGKPAIQSIFENLSSSFSSSLNVLSDKIADLLVVKKNIIAAYPFQILSTVLDKFCSSTLFMHHVPPRFTPDITQMHFQYITRCQNYSVPLMRAQKLWRYMGSIRNRRQKVVILATGWTNTVNDSSAITLLSTAFLCRKDVSFIIVDAAYYVDTFYKWAALNTEEIGEHIARGLMQLVKVVPLRNIHLVGHSLGAHIMGNAGRTFTKLTGRKIPRITGLDPAKPCFLKNNTLSSLRRGDATFVDIIHTNIGMLAKKKPNGDIDFYPGGANALPPGCLTASCAHTRALEYFAESAYPGNWNNFQGLKCRNWEALKILNCTSRNTAVMGYMVNRGRRGIYYVDVNRNSPYGKFAKPQSVRWEYVRCNKCR